MASDMVLGLINIGKTILLCDILENEDKICE